MSAITFPVVTPAVAFHDRFRAVEFVFGIAPYARYAAVARTRALTFASVGDYHAIDASDAEPGGGITVRPGRYEAPIFVASVGDEIVGVAVGSCDTPGLPVRIQMLAVRDDFRCRGVGGALVRAMVGAAPVVGVASPDDMRGFYERRGFSHWRVGASGGAMGFTRPVNDIGMHYVVPVATDDEIAAAREVCHV